eukprot:4358433-Amphidinium_carterae.1
MAPRDECLRRSGWSVIELDGAGNVVREAFGACPLELCPQQSAPEAEDYALYMLGRMRAQMDIDPLRVGSDCKNTVRAAGRGPGGPWRRKARSLLWGSIWTDFPQGVNVFKVKAHLTAHQVGADDFARLCWLGNARADERAKQGALQHPGGQQQLRRGQVLTQRVAELYRFMAKQGAMLATGEVSDMDELRNHTSGCVRIKRCRGRRRHWEAPEWLKRMAGLAQRVVVPASAVSQVGVQFLSPPMRRFAERGTGHDWRLHQVRDSEGNGRGK